MINRNQEIRVRAAGWPRVRWIAAFMTLCCFDPVALAQSTSSIGSFMQPGWGEGQVGSFAGLWVASGPISMTLNGEWVAFVENDGAPCDSSAYDERISMMRTDGTDHRVIVDWHVLKALQVGQTRVVERIRVSPEGRQIYFEQAVWTGCEQVGAPIPYVVDVFSGLVEPLVHDGQTAYLMSYSDDASRIVFRAFDPERGSSRFYLSDRDLLAPRAFLDTAPWWSVPQGKLCGDASKFLFIVWHGSVWGDLLIMDMGTGGLITLTSEPMQSLYSADVSADGQRVVFGNWASTGVLYAIESDGSNPRVIAQGSQVGVATISRDGNVIFGFGGSVAIGLVTWSQMNVYRWNDGALIDQYLGGGGSGAIGPMAHAAIDSDGSLVAGRQGAPPVGLEPLMVRTTDLPAVTTYGFGDPDTPIHWDVCAAAGSDWVLAASLRKGLLPLPGVGDLLLSPEHLFVLDAGTISGPYNASTVTREIPVDAALPEVLPLHSQALVVSPEGEARLTNRTTFELHGVQAATADVSTSSNGSEGLPDGPAQGEPWDAMTRRPSLWELSPAERLRRMELMDPSIAWRRERGLLPAGSP